MKKKNMPIIRNGDTPAYCEFALRYAIISYNNPQTSWNPAVAELRPSPIEIPTYQRGIVWRRQEVEELIDSNSALFGNVILARYQGRPFTLIDGLQRFATATALLVKLYNEVLSPTPANPTAASYFRRLQSLAAGRQPIVSHNNTMLKTHDRMALRESYLALSEGINEIVNEGLASNASEFATKIQNVLLDKQIAIDPYSDFNDRIELTNTFISMNSTGLILSEVDLLRADLVEQAISRSWSVAQIQEMENRFTEIFENNTNKSYMKVLGKNIYKGIKSNPEHIFPNWATLQIEDVNNLLDFIDNTIEASESNQFTYLKEIFECGGLPFTITMMYFYRLYMRGDNPDFLGGNNNTTYACRLLLRAFYRRLIDGTIGQIGNVAFALITDVITTVEDLASQINLEATIGPLNNEPNHLWLVQRLRQCDITRSKRVFNACMLPERIIPAGVFSPLTFGRKRLEFAIDHLIPISSITSPSLGEYEMELLTNFAPLTNELNSDVRTTPCELKLRPNTGVYSRLLRQHPFIDWLVNEHYAGPANNPRVPVNGVHPLDMQSCLELNANPPIGDERIQKLAEILSTRL